MTPNERLAIHEACTAHEAECDRAASIRMSVTISAGLFLKSTKRMRSAYLDLLRLYVTEHDTQTARVDAAKKRMDDLLASHSP